MIVGCVTSPETSKKTDISTSKSNLKPDENRAVLIVYRKWVPPLIFPVTAHIDGVESFSLPYNSFSMVYLEPGVHKVKISWPFLALTPSKEISITTQVNKYYFLEFGGQINATGVRASVYSSYEFNFSDNLVYFDDIKDCCGYVK